ncbi:MAG: hypothetical protein RL693_2157 [Verrucomicrobiota bacterium]|jgi:hypothetical protein
MLRYFARLNFSRKVLWCYLLWWIHTVVHHFDPSPRLWINSLGISGIIGVALLLSTRTSSQGVTKLDGWQIFRLFLMPFCVSSFAALVKSAGFFLIFPPSLTEKLSAFGTIALFLALTWVLERVMRPRA